MQKNIRKTVLVAEKQYKNGPMQKNITKRILMVEKQYKKWSYAETYYRNGPYDIKIFLKWSQNIDINSPRGRKILLNWSKNNCISGTCCRKRLQKSHCGRKLLKTGPYKQKQLYKWSGNKYKQ